MNPSPNFKKYYEQQDPYIPAVIKILEENAKYPIQIIKVDKKTDCEDCHDLIVAYSNPLITIGVRIRFNCIYRDFTLRKALNSDNQTEIDKIKKLKKPDYYFYGWVNNQILDEWMVIDMKKFFPFIDGGFEKENKDKILFQVYSESLIKDSILQNNILRRYDYEKKRMVRRNKN